MRVLSPLFLAAFVGGCALIAFVPLAGADHWITDSSIRPAAPLRGGSTEFTFSMHNGADETLYVSWVRAEFCWNASTVRYGNVVFMEDGEVTIPPLGIREFSATVDMGNASVGSCAVRLYAEAHTLGIYGEHGIAEYTATLDVHPRPPLVVNATASPGWGVAPQKVVFSAEAEGGLPPYRFNWSFSDGFQKDGNEVNRTFPLAGLYRATVTVLDALQTRTDVSVSATVGPELSSRAEADRSSAPIRTPVGFFGEAFGGEAPYYYSWNFGDGTATSAAEATHAFDYAGTFTVTLTVQDAGGRTSVITLTHEAQSTLWEGSGRGMGPLPLALIGVSVALAAVGVALLFRHRSLKLRSSLHAAGALRPAAPPTRVCPQCGDKIAGAWCGRCGYGRP